MSNAVYPSLPGLMFPVTKTPRFSTQIKQAVSGRELRRANYTFPLVAFGLQYEFLRDTVEFPELKTLLAFFMARQGSFDSFLFRDPDDYQVVNQQFGIGDGVTRSFQLVRSVHGLTEPVCNIANLTLVPLMWSADGQTSMWLSNGSAPMWSVYGTAPMWTNVRSYALGVDFTVSSTGLITFTTAPVSGETLIWSGEYYYRCRFIDDAQDFSKFMHQLWEHKKCSFIGSLGGRL